MEVGCFERVLDADLVAQLVRLLREERRLTAAVLAHLGEVEARRLYLPAACSSMFVYCKAEIDVLLARLAPKPDVPERLERVGQEVLVPELTIDHILRRSRV